MLTVPQLAGLSEEKALTDITWKQLRSCFGLAYWPYGFSGMLGGLYAEGRASLADAIWEAMGAGRVSDLIYEAGKLDASIYGHPIPPHVALTNSRTGWINPKPHYAVFKMTVNRDDALHGVTGNLNGVPIESGAVPGDLGGGVRLPRYLAQSLYTREFVYPATKTVRIPGTYTYQKVPYEATVQLADCQTFSSSLDAARLNYGLLLQTNGLGAARAVTVNGLIATISLIQNDLAPFADDLLTLSPGWDQGNPATLAYYRAAFPTGYTRVVGKDGSIVRD